MHLVDVAEQGVELLQGAGVPALAGGLVRGHAGRAGDADDDGGLEVDGVDGQVGSVVPVLLQVGVRHQLDASDDVDGPHLGVAVVLDEDGRVLPALPLVLPVEGEGDDVV